LNQYADHQEMVEQLYEPSALYALSWGRDVGDNYTCRVQPLSVDNVPSKEEIDTIFPTGSNWLPAKGWRNIFGMPFLLHGQQYLAVGVESVYPHHRGAVAALDAYVYPISQPPMNGIAAAIATFGVVGIARDALNATHGIVRTSSRTPEEHRHIELTILRHVLASYKKQERLLFATILLTEDRLKMPGSPSPLSKSPGRNFVLDYQRYLIATVPSIETTFSFKTKVWLKSCKHLF